MIAWARFVNDERSESDALKLFLLSEAIDLDEDRHRTLRAISLVVFRHSCLRSPD